MYHYKIVHEDNFFVLDSSVMEGFEGYNSSIRTLVAAEKAMHDNQLTMDDHYIVICTK